MDGKLVRWALGVLGSGVSVLALGLVGGAASASAAAAGNDACGYPAASFTESTVMRWAQINGDGTNAQFVAFANDEKGLLLGVNGATPLLSSPTNGSNGQPGAVSHHASGASGGDPAPTDPSGRPFYPALYITNLTAHPLNGGTGAGDFQNGGSPRNLSGGTPFVDDVFGSWSTATLSGGTYKVTAPPAQNDWNLGVGSDTPNGTTFAAMGNEGFGAEARWSVSNLTDSDGNPIVPGNTYRFQVIEHDGDQNKAGGDAGEFCANLKIPGITTDATNSTAPGPIHDVAHLSGSNGPGTITFRLYHAGANCTGSALFTDSVSTNGDGDYQSGDFTPTSAGDYQWQASFSSGGGAAIVSRCGDPRELSTVHKAQPAIATSASSGTVGQSIQDVAILTGGDHPTGTITWKLYGPGDSSCQTPIQTFTAPANGDGNYTSPAYNTTSAGIYRWVASYSGDANNKAVSGACNDRNEQSTVKKASPAIATSASSGTVGQSIQDVAILTGGHNPTGTITWKLYGPGDSACQTPIQTFTAPANGDGNYTSPAYNTTSAGTYLWVASYSGDANNDSASGACNDTNEQSTVKKASPALTTDAVSGTAGQPIHDVAHLSGGFSPGGTISWNVYASSDTSCTTPLNTTAFSVPVTGDGDYTSPDFTPSTAGSYQWVATYSGDANNNSISTRCGDPREVSTVHKAPAPGIKTVKFQRIGSGSFTRAILVVTEHKGHYVLYRIDYEIRVTNTGNEPLALSLNDPVCDPGTAQGPFPVSGSLVGNVLSPGGVAQYTCSHQYRQGDSPALTNVATVTGKPPAGPPVHSTSQVTTKKRTVSPKPRFCRSRKTGRLVRWPRHTPKPRACRKPIPHKPKHPRGFTG